MTGHEEQLRRLAIADAGRLRTLFGADLSPGGVPDLDARTRALVRLAGLVGLGATGVACHWGVGEALAAGASEEGVAAVLVALRPVVGAVRVDSVVPDVALALGWDVDAHGHLVRPEPGDG